MCDRGAGGQSLPGGSLWGTLWNHWEAASPGKAPAHQKGHASPSIPSPLQRFQYVEVPDNHYVHLNQPQNVAGFISAFLLSKETAPHEP